MEKKTAICKYCKKSFERDGETVKIGIRYAHKECYEAHMIEIQELKELTDAISEVYKEWEREPNWTLIGRQLEKLSNEGYSYALLKQRMDRHSKSSYFDLDRAQGVGFLRYEPFDYKGNKITKDDVVSKLIKNIEREDDEETAV